MIQIAVEKGNSNKDTLVMRRGSIARSVSLLLLTAGALTMGAQAQVTAEIGGPATIATVATMTIVNAEVGALRSIDGGKTWQVLCADAAGQLQAQLASKLSAGHHGVDVKPTGRTTVHPNPVADRVTIHYELGAPGEVNVALHDLHGREVLRAFEGPRAAGEHSLSLETGSLTEGVYQYRIVSSGLIIAGSTMVVAR